MAVQTARGRLPVAIGALAIPIALLILIFGGTYPPYVQVMSLGPFRPPGLTADAHFGTAVAMDLAASNVRAAVSAPGIATIFVLEFAGQGWNLHSTIAPGGFTASDRFGESIAVSGDRIIVGIPGQHGKHGGAQVFDFANGSWQLTADLFNLAAGTAAGSSLTCPPAGTAIAECTQLGASVALDGDHAVVGAPFAAFGGQFLGTAFFFHRTASGVWEFRFESHDAEFQGFDEMGRSASIHNRTAAIGIPGGDFGDQQFAGGTYVYQRQADTGDWFPFPFSLDGVLAAAPSPPIEAGDRLGTAVSVFGDFLWGGAPQKHSPDGSSPAVGKVFVFKKSNDQIGTPAQDIHKWTWSQSLTDPAPEDRFPQFGDALKLRNSYGLIRQQPRSGSNGPLLHIYTREQGLSIFLSDSWRLFDSLSSPPGVGPQGYAAGFDLNPPHILVGAPNSNGGEGLLMQYRLMTPADLVIQSIVDWYNRNHPGH